MSAGRRPRLPINARFWCSATVKATPREHTSTVVVAGNIHRSICSGNRSKKGEQLWVPVVEENEGMNMELRDRVSALCSMGKMDEV